MSQPPVFTAPRPNQIGPTVSKKVNEAPEMIRGLFLIADGLAEPSSATLETMPLKLINILTSRPRCPNSGPSAAQWVRAGVP